MGLFNRNKKKNRREAVTTSVTRDRSDDLLNPLNPISPLNPINQPYYGDSDHEQDRDRGGNYSPPAVEDKLDYGGEYNDTGHGSDGTNQDDYGSSGGSDYGSSYDSGSSSSYDSGSSSSYDSGSYGGDSGGGGGGGE